MIFHFNQVKLETLDLAGNRISKFQNIDHLKRLTELWVIIMLYNISDNP